MFDEVSGIPAQVNFAFMVLISVLGASIFHTKTIFGGEGSLTLFEWRQHVGLRHLRAIPATPPWARDTRAGSCCLLETNNNDVTMLARPQCAGRIRNYIWMRIEKRRRRVWGCLRFSTKDSALGGPMARSNTTGKYQISSKQEGKMIWKLKACVKWAVSR